MPTPALSSLTNTPTHHADSCLSLSTALLDLLKSTIPIHRPARILSIGSGSGLLETLLQIHINSPLANQTDTPPITVHGIEPHPGSANKYLPGQALHLVPGTWALYEGARCYHVWLFVYPRAVRLVDAYLDAVMGGKRESDDYDYDNDCNDDNCNGLPDRIGCSDKDGGSGDAFTTIPQDSAQDDTGRTIVWAGPRADWLDFAACFQGRRGMECVGLYPGREGGVAEWEVVCVFRCTGAVTAEKMDHSVMFHEDESVDV